MINKVKINFTKKEWDTRYDTQTKADKFVWKVTDAIAKANDSQTARDYIIASIKQEDTQEKIDAKYFEAIIK